MEIQLRQGNLSELNKVLEKVFAIPSLRDIAHPL